MPAVEALIIASFGGAGFGGALAMARWDAVSVLEHVMAVVRRGGVENLAVVLGPHSDDVMASTDLGDAVIVVDPEWEEGRAAGVRTGLDTLSRSPDTESALIVDLEYPDIDSETVEAIVADRLVAEAPVSIARYRYARGGPVCADRSLWSRLMGLEGDVDLVGVITAHPQWISEVRIGRLPPTRVTSPDDLASASGLR